MTTYATVSTETVSLPPGSVLRMPGSWEDYRALSHSRGDASIPRIKYTGGEVALMAPLPRHGRDAHLLARIIETLLDRQNRTYEAFTPITMELPEIGGIEPDYCFYIDNWQSVAGHDRIQWGTDPAPDLVIEVDVTTYTNIDDYLPYAVSEVWLLKQRSLNLHQLKGEAYQLVNNSLFFPGVGLQAIVTEVLEAANTVGSGAAIQQLRQRLQSQEF